MTMYITPEMILENRQGTWAGDIVVKGDVPPHSILHVTHGNLRVMGNIGFGARVQVSGHLQAQNVYEKASLKADTMDVKHVGKDAELIAYSKRMHIRGDVHEGAYLYCHDTIWFEGHVDASAEVIAQKKMHMTETARAQRKPLKDGAALYYRWPHEPDARPQQPLQHLGRNITYHPLSKLYVIPVYEKEDFAALETLFTDIGATIESHHAISRYDSLAPALVVSAGNRWGVDQLIRRQIADIVREDGISR